MKQTSIINIPNLITLLRLLLIPPFAFLVLRGNMQLALLLFIAMVLSDKLDGLSAKLTGQMTRLGGLFDGAVDWILIISSAAIFLAKGYVPKELFIWFVALSPVFVVSKLAYIKTHKKGATSTIPAKVTVSFAYLVIGGLLIDFSYNYLLVLLFIFSFGFTTISYFIKSAKNYQKG